MSTEHLIASMLTWWLRPRVTADKRARARESCLLFLSRTCKGDDILALDALRLRLEHLVLCPEGAHNGVCHHMMGVRTQLEAIRLARLSPLLLMHSVMKTFFEARSCPAAAARAHFHIRALADMILNSVGEWGDTVISHMSSLMGPSGRKRCRIDSHVKFTSAVARQPGAPDVPLANRDRKRLPDFKLEVLRCQVAANWLHCSMPTTISSTFDAGRVGRPSKELLLHLVWLPRKGVGVPLPPRVLHR